MAIGGSEFPVAVDAGGTSEAQSAVLCEMPPRISRSAGFFQATRQSRLQTIRFAPLTFGREQSDALRKPLQRMTTFVMKPDV
jgi:hypothetical protein